ncbi:Asp-tRNA(Asn)/Glu-tRNA(Gln) amidotransferase subunit GatA [Ferrovum myxofaciens]|uniref:Glutamyl-tRNA(Gln) amidotransferase subunit A n=1 Tax=Ferrovum myxofaciens TaxID=416213 RepID=A0A8F3DXE2_9PROT|nr:Asp-tRNA(Asn)/Glu-tRNA(Gln) amidotransferase subunit GatA [Ferrovum myxofaciens]KXW59396.1 glutamyl-tRNA(Gln) amidotransferase subunit A [Ferrovum myxofaciens]MBU6994327.1 Asp-tRNA(Asn)/Glu-tRNA(Gln) amidotransferase subunit GatA [Ferrovum myxofaciens]QKE38227.1 MAG: Asp-tRNA(Asn)/Glu-tRNA(Gln) amidotransferase subunit GatA [Ferrovum myxofaciens]QWY75957.1 MAG: Asp-tRNA(Asn)/Glu-tRNA(Gln) amidotransferase subunit GatA [Ferrovum myxofaciens]QWY78689.1 MAG: Asp-tRNA(Asn)/Glu-tRNA(Gln) amidotr
MNLDDTSLRMLCAGLRERTFSSEELTQAYLQRIEQYNTRLGCFITVDPERSLSQARAADIRLARGEGGPLLGIPVAHKDIFCTEGWLTTCGSRMLSNFVAPYDAHVIQRFKEAGSVILGKTNMDEFAMGSSNETSFYGPVHNPWQLTHVPGGSSGGSAAAVAARLAPLATATDTGGSIRQPAAFCGISGLKPTYGRVSRYGMIAFASSLDQGGLMAPSAADLAWSLGTLTGFDERDATSVARPEEDFGAQLEHSLEGLRIGLPRQYFGSGIAPGVAQAVEEALRVYESRGARLVEVDLPHSELSVPVYYVLAPAEASSNLSRYDGVRYGWRASQYGDLNEMIARSRAEGFGAEVKLRILTGAYVLSQGYYDAYYLQAQRVRRLIQQDFLQAFEQCDVLMGPTTPSTAFRFGDKGSDPVQMYLSDIFTIGVNLAGLPGMSIPVGFDGQGLPVGLQLIGPHFSEARLLAVAHGYQQATDWHARVPGRGEQA